MPSPARNRAVPRTLAAVATAALTCTLALTPLTAASAAIVSDPITDSAPGATLALAPIGTHETGVFDESAAEIVQSYRDRLYVVNAQAGSVTVLDNSDPTAPAELFTLSDAGTANSLAVRDDGLGVVAFEAEDKTAAGTLVFFDADADDAASARLGSVTVGALPDMVTISADGAYAVVANEGEPADDFSLDPEGSIGVVSLPRTVTAPEQQAVRIAGFDAFEAGGSTPLHPDVRVFGPDVAAPDQGDRPLEANRVSRNLEPEYITVAGTTAYAALQEANAIAVIDLAKAEVTGVLPLGFVDHGADGHGLDPSDRDERIDIRTFPGLKGMPMPDGIQSYSATVDGAAATYLVTANEGDAREWGDYAEAVRVKDLGDDGLAPVCADSPLAAQLGDDQLGRLNVTTENGLPADGSCYDELYAFGSRSFSIWGTDGTLVFDSGDEFEQIIARVAPEYFDSNHTEANLEGRSDDKGPEPENLSIGTVGGRTYAFIGFERVGGVIVYDITDPTAASYVTYVNNRDFAADAESPAAGDLGPEGIQFIPALRSPSGEPLLVVGNEVSGTTTVYAVDQLVGGAPAVEPDIRVVTINDFHGRLVPESNGVAGAGVLAGAVSAFRQQNPNTLFVSAGDNIGASAFESFIDEDAPTIDALRAAGLDVSAVGNHEFDRGFADLTERVIPRYEGDPDADAFSDLALGANVFVAGTDEHALQPYTIREVDGTKVAFVGTVTQQTAGMVSPQGIAGIEFRDQVASANDAAAAAVAEGAAVVVLLAHEGSAGSDCTAIATESGDFGELVRGASSDIDAIVSAHTHQRYACEIGGRPVIQAHQYGTTVGTLDITLTDAGELESITGGTVPLVDATLGRPVAYPDPATAGIVDAAVQVADEKGRVQVGSITGDILRGKTAAGAEDRGVHSTLGNTVADVYLWATTQNPGYGGQKAEIAFMNPGGLRADLAFGNDGGAVSYREVANVQPFANTLVTLELTPAQIRQVLEEQWQPAGASRPKLAMGVSKGFTFEYDPDAAAGSHIRSMQLNGEELALDDTTTSIRVVTNSFLAGGGDNFATFVEGAAAADSGQVDLQATVEFFAAVGPVAPSPANRAYIAGEQPPVEQPGFPGPGSPGEPGEGEPGEGEPGEGEPAQPWATVELASDTVAQGGTLEVTVSGLEPGQQIAATLFSDPVVVTGIPAADAAGRTEFTVAVPRDFPTGAHRLVVTSGALDPIEVAVTVTAAAPAGTIAVTGGTAPIGFAVAGALALALGGLLVAARRRQTS
ncbi:bifunctional metallophosphatase/5'-nucleotidase [Microbacterium sp. cf332]|uniref:bifunctional metallophosphatase/5'-nucleotidase n=1 Tax=Microbacterium sp. cf332 TaxID=1761804 RepID=UPI00088DFF08|nr:bifunctional metallophosphatase/5'-nucleotidase [Microbacterium sp. cf332]SDQ67912.1 2',3'-cyclic-nucleotide 2'-phosphodiesterase/5'-or 3'-nucleotidase, 5'-nucleotidase family [Microbacterium sp. cf332]